jgi:beta-glucosidase/6-phospho-beta-glucosidase/beta-galactosidase
MEDQINQTALNRYVAIINALTTRNIEPIITIYHSVLPWWLASDGGVLSSNFSQRYTRYASTIVPLFASLGVKYFLTFNEPSTFCEGESAVNSLVL